MQVAVVVAKKVRLPVAQAAQVAVVVEQFQEITE
jgi:hypothetical protein